MNTAATTTPVSEPIVWHAIVADEVAMRLQTDSAKGLDAGEASERLTKYGLNRLPEGKKQSPFMKFLQQFNNILVYVLLGAGFVKMMVGLWLDSAIILSVVVLNALLFIRPIAFIIILAHQFFDLACTISYLEKRKGNNKKKNNKQSIHRQ